jgi:hypothetical protein
MNGERPNRVVRRRTTQVAKRRRTMKRMKTEIGPTDVFRRVDESVPMMMKLSQPFLSMVRVVRVRVIPLEYYPTQQQHKRQQRCEETVFILDVPFGVEILGAVRPARPPPIVSPAVRIAASDETPFTPDVPCAVGEGGEMMEPPSCHDNPFNPSHLPSSLYPAKLNSWMMKMTTSTMKT